MTWVILCESVREAFLEEVSLKHLATAGNSAFQAYLVLLCFALFCFTDTAGFFCTLKVCGNPVLSKSVPAIFPTALFFN